MAVGPLLADYQSKHAVSPTVRTCDERATMKAQIQKHRERLEGRVLVPALLWMAGVPFGIVVLLWFFFFRGN
jgi:hypothetical protein